MSIKNKIITLKKRAFYYRRLRQLELKKIRSIAVIFYIPKSNTSKYKNWEDGFTGAVELLSKNYQITWINIADEKPSAEALNQFDFLIVKSCWDWIVDKYIRSLKNLNVCKGIAISCSKAPNNNHSIYDYDVLWFETQWHGKSLKKHPRAFQAFGINTDKFYDQNLDKQIDVLSVGALASYKRHDFILKESGKQKVVIGDKSNKASEVLKKDLIDNGVEVMDYTTQEELAMIINKSKMVYIPAEINGGGERAVLEARACKTPVKVEEDNPKLIELLTSKIWTEKDYYEGLLKGINSLNK